MNELQWLGLFMVIIGSAGAFFCCWYFELKEEIEYKSFECENNKIQQRILMQLFAQDCFEFNLFNLNDLRKPPKTATIEQVRKSTMLEF
jgi:hypothetical protein